MLASFLGLPLPQEGRANMPTVGLKSSIAKGLQQI
jgi:hypothetical protein